MFYEHQNLKKEGVYVGTQVVPLVLRLAKHMSLMLILCPIYILLNSKLTMLFELIQIVELSLTSV